MPRKREDEKANATRAAKPRRKTPYVDEETTPEFAPGQETPLDDFQRNRRGIYGGLPRARRNATNGPSGSGKKK